MVPVRNSVCHLTYLFAYLTCSYFRKHKRARNAGDSSEGPYPFPFRTRQSSPLEPMVLRKGESRLSPAFRARFRIYLGHVLGR